MAAPGRSPHEQHIPVPRSGAGTGSTGLPGNNPLWGEPPNPAYGPGAGSYPDQQRQAARPAPPGPSQAWGVTDEPSQEEQSWASLRREVASRLRSINAKHMHEAFDRIGRRNALGPHGVVLFYRAPDPREQYGFRLYFVTRLFLAGPESDALVRVISDLTFSATDNIARAGAAGRRWDPRGPEGSMVNGGEMSMPRDAVFVGTGVTTLDTEQGDWYTVSNSVLNQPVNASRAKSVFDLPGLCIALLNDGTALRVVRDPNRRIGDDGVTCNQTLDPYRSRHWNRYSDLTAHGDATIRAAWTHLSTLQRTLQEYLDPGRAS
jgi:hypothetical protein